MYYTKRWAFERCQQFFGIPDDVAQAIAGREGLAMLQVLWDADPAGFYEHPLTLLRQEWWHQESGQYKHEGFWAALPFAARVLDYGCGTGEVVRPWLHHPSAPRRVTLLEASATCRGYLRHKYQMQYESTAVWIEDERTIGDCFPGSFDALICTDVLEHVPNPLELQAQLWALLQPGGYALLKMESAYPHPGHLPEAVTQFPAWKQWIRDHTEIIEVETYVWCRKPPEVRTL